MRLTLVVGLILISGSVLADTHASLLSRFDPNCAHLVLQVGGFRASQGESQHIGINGLIGDRFTIRHDYDENALLGLGYFVDGNTWGRVNVLYGLNAFYLMYANVKGNVVQENIFTNLSYQYSITNYPVYLAAKALIPIHQDKAQVTIDVGIGPNFIQANGFEENSLDGGVTIPDHPFKGQTSTVLSATVGVGLKFNHVIGRVPLEIGYRFFYLGEGSLKKANPQLKNTLQTGNSYANALIISAYI